MEDEEGEHWEGGSAEKDPPWSLFAETGTCVFRKVCEGCVDWRWILGVCVGIERGQRALHLTLKSMQCRRPSVAIRWIDHHPRANQFPLFSLHKRILAGEL